MDEVKFNLKTNGEGSFYIENETKQVAKMEISIRKDHLTVYHTEVAAEAEGKGLAKILLSAMVEYARKNKLMVVPYCPFVHLQFRRHPEEYADIWFKEEIEN